VYSSDYGLSRKAKNGKSLPRWFTMLHFFLHPGSQLRAGMHCLLNSDSSSAIAALPLAQINGLGRLHPAVTSARASAGRVCLALCRLLSSQQSHALREPVHGMQWPLVGLVLKVCVFNPTPHIHGAVLRNFGAPVLA
jgi:hypothetical protein